MARRLTQKQKIFCQKYLVLRNATEAAILAGYSPRSIRNIASVNLTKANIKQYIDELNEKTESDAVMTVREIKERLSEIGRARLTDYTTCGPDRDLINVGPESPNTAALQEITTRTEYDNDGAGVAVITKIKLHNPMTAMDMLNKMRGDYPPSKTEFTGKGGGPVILKVVYDDSDRRD
jgi:phage terminase small subunit